MVINFKKLSKLKLKKLKEKLKINERNKVINTKIIIKGRNHIHRFLR